MNDDVKKAAKAFATLGGKARKAQNPDYGAMGKKGMAKRWAGHENCTPENCIHRRKKKDGG